MFLKKNLKKLSLLIAVTLLFTVYIAAVSAEAVSLSVPQIRRIIDADVQGEELGILENSGYVYRDKAYSYWANYCVSLSSKTEFVSNGENALEVIYNNQKVTDEGEFTKDYIYAYIWSTVAVARCVDYENTALQFMYNPRYARETAYIGITCRCSASGGDAVLRIPLNEYISITEPDYAQNEWIKVTIPLDYFIEKGTFDPLKGTATSFKKQSINGVLFGYSHEGLINKPNTTLAYFDDIRFVNVPVQPKNLSYHTSGNSVTLSWNGLSDNTADRYLVYRDGVLLGSVNGEASYTDNTVTNGNSYIYSVVSVSEGGARSVASHIEVKAGSLNIGSFTEDGNLSAYSGGSAFSDNGAALMFSGSENADSFVIYKNNSPYGQSSNGYFYDNSYAQGDIYSIYAVNSEERIKSAPVSPLDQSVHEEVTKYIAFAADRTSIDEKIPIAITWNRHSTASSDTAEFGGASLRYIGVAKTPMHNRIATSDGNNFTVPGADRYRIMPITTIDKTASPIKLGTEPKKGETFAANIEGFEDSSVTVEIAKGANYNSNIKGVKIGLAYVDLNTTTTYQVNASSTQKVYATGISWYDVTSTVAAFPSYVASNSWNDVKEKLSVKVSDIINKGEKVYLHGAAAGTHKVTASNANAIVIDIKYADATTTATNSKVILFDNLAVEKTVVTEIETESLNMDEVSLSAELTDASGNIYNGKAVSEAYPDRIKLKSVNTTETSKTAKLIAAMYEGGKLTDVKFFNAAVPFGIAEQTLYPGFYSNVPGEREIKLLTLDGYNFPQPLSSPETSQQSLSRKAADASVTVLDTEYQTITGWGISPFLVTDNDFRSFSNYEDWKEMYDTLYGGLGITSIRVPIEADCGYATEPEDEELRDKPDYSKLDYIVKYIQRAKDFGIDDWILCFWSPPKYMFEKKFFAEKDTELYFLKDEYKDVYCSYIINILDYLKENGVGTPKGVCFQNEPIGNISPFYELSGYKYEAIKLREMLDDAGYEDTLVQGPETASYCTAFRYLGGEYGNVNFNNLRNDPEYADAIGVISQHTYVSSSDSKNSDIANFANGASYFPDKERWMTEFSGLGKEETSDTGDYVMGPVLFTMRVLSGDVGWAGMNRWYYWRAFVTHYNPDDNGASYDVLNDKNAQQTILYGQPGGKVVKSKLYDCLSLLFNNVPVGSKVKRLATTDSLLVNKSALKTDLLAFETNKGTVVMLVNTKPQAKSIDFGGLTGSKAEIYSVAGGYDGIIKDQTTVNGGTAYGVHIPPKSVTFVVSSR